MPIDVRVRMLLPLSTHPVVGPPALHFARWLPERAEDEITSTVDGVTVTLSFARDSNGVPADADLSKRTGVLVHQVNVVAAAQITRELWEYMVSLDALTDVDRTTGLGEQYVQLGRSIYVATVSRVNRLLTYAIGRGQYWMADFEVDPQNIEGFFIRAQAHFAEGSDGSKCRWRPDPVSRMTVALLPEERFLRRDEWDTVKLWVDGKARPDVVNEMLAVSELLLGYGYVRSALAEAVAALEVCLSRFASSAPMPELDMNRYPVASLGRLVEHLGLSATVSFLLPTLFSQDVISNETFCVCRDAIASRNVVLHNGARNVNEAAVSGQIRSSRELCAALVAHSGPAGIRPRRMP